MKDCLKRCSITTPLGDMTAIADDSHLFMLSFDDSKKLQRTIEKIKKETKLEIEEGTNKVLDLVNNQLEDYFNKKLKKFTVPMKLLGTDFQKEIWGQISKLEFGMTKSYGEIAVMAGRDSKHSRSIGNASGANPIPIIIPCHRVVAHNDQLGGFSCGGHRKIWLLKHENSLPKS